MSDSEQHRRIQEFYDREYYAADGGASHEVNWHERLIARRLGDLQGKRVLDVACGLGQWLGLLHSMGAGIDGVDISEQAVATCRARFPDGRFQQSVAEELPYADGSFDLVTCMGSLEHFVDKPAALREMVRVAKADASFLILVPNSGFLTRRLGLYGGTRQARVREDVYSLAEWRALLSSAGLSVRQRWRDLHTLSRHWICQGRPVVWPVRAAQALALCAWPLSWQYQVHHYCRKSAGLPG